MHLQSISETKLQFERVNNQMLELIGAEKVDEISPSIVCIKAGTEVRETWRPFSEAVARGNELLVRYMLEQGVDPTDSPYNGRSSLTNAILNRNERILGLLLKRSPGEAFTVGHKPTIRLLLEENLLSTPLALSFTHGAGTVTNMLLESGAHVIYTARDLMIKTAATDVRNAMRTLLKHGGEPIAYQSFCSPVSSNASTYGKVPPLPSQAKTDTKSSYLWPTPTSHRGDLQERNASFGVLIVDDSDDLSSKNCDGFTALMWAAAQGYEAICRGLLGSEADLESTDKLGATALTWAARNDHEGIFRNLLEKGANPDCADTPETTLLSWACQQGRKNIVEMLLSRGAPPDRQDRAGNTPLHLAMRAMLEQRLLQESIVNRTTPTDSYPGEAMSIFETIVEKLLSRGANPDRMDSYGNTPLNLAVIHRSDAVVKLLLDNGASCDARNGVGETALGLAIGGDQAILAETLLKAGASPDMASEYHFDGKERPLEIAIRIRSTKLVQLLLEAGADLDFRTERGEKLPLMLAATYGREDVVKLLLDHGADLTVGDWDGQTALDMAGNETIRQIFKADIARRKKKRKRSEDESDEGKDNDSPGQL
ncbi:hypothetical protein H2200_012541 [Cladophialophora chaetospira]|uniref:Ankyrin n=1 Tax=Cladophialophora chaetospira TaxID=386627 RepID=A0AA38WX49_9EURO|nr:hypothetical protein H2200_012541 [Cladophialophora chaetospira]